MVYKLAICRGLSQWFFATSPASMTQAQSLLYDELLNRLDKAVGGEQAKPEPRKPRKLTKEQLKILSEKK